MFDAGVCRICEFRNDKPAGLMPAGYLVPVADVYFGERMVGYNRFYAAAGVNEQIDLMIRTWRLPCAKIGMYAVLSQSENDGQYRITNVQHLLDDDGLKVTDLTLSRVEDFYNVKPAE